MSVSGSAGSFLFRRLAVVVSAWLCVTAATCSSKSLNETFTNNTGAAQTYLCLNVKVWTNNTGQFPNLTNVQWYNNNSPARIVETGDAGSGYNFFTICFTVNAAAGAKAHVGGTFANRSSDAIYIDLLSHVFTNTLPSPAPSVERVAPEGGTASMPGLTFTVDVDPLEPDQLIITVENPTPQTNWLQQLDIAASDVDVSIDNLTWGDPQFDGLPWQSVSGPDFPTPIDDSTGPQVFRVSTLGMMGCNAYLRFRANRTADDDSDQLGAATRPLPCAQNVAGVRLNIATTPSDGAAGVDIVNVTGSGFPFGIVSPDNVTVTLSTACGDTAAATTAALSVETIIGSSMRVGFLIPDGTPAGRYFVAIHDTALSDPYFSSGNCSELNVVQ
jgi:hypothetical protein